LYGATKLCSDKLFVQSNSYGGEGGTRFSCVRYGNVVGSRGSVIPLFQNQRATGRLTVTDERMTRFWMTLDQAALFVIDCIERMKGGEIFVPKIPSMSIVDLARAMAPECEIESIGIRPGEKLHELLVSEDEARNTRELNDRYVVHPVAPWWGTTGAEEGSSLPDGFVYSSDQNPHQLSIEELQSLIEEHS
jgi:FlaA1/EpsC-like NDP-sugar epimerase